MTREEIIGYAEAKKAKLQERMDGPDSMYGGYAIYSSELEFVSASLTALREQEEQENQKPLTLEELQTMAGEPVWCSEYQCYGIIEIETVGRWANIPFLVGVWHDRGVVEKFEHNIIKRRLALFRSKPKSLNGG